jgi:hypothetical protein
MHRFMWGYVERKSATNSRVGRTATLNVAGVAVVDVRDSTFIATVIHTQAGKSRISGTERITGKAEIAGRLIGHM